MVWYVTDTTHPSRQTVMISFDNYVLQACACSTLNIAAFSLPAGHAQYDPRKPLPKRHTMQQPKVHAARQPQLVAVS